MREILFRGKIIELCEYQGQWLEGFYAVENGKPFIAIPKENGLNGFYCDPETVGQYTGLKDLHGRSVFEGDIVKIHLSGKPAIGVVEFGITGIAAYIVKNIDKVSSNYVLEFDKPNLYEVVGNVFDNSLEGKT